MKNILSFFKIIAVIGLCIFLFLSIKQKQSYKERLNISEQNLKAYKNDVRQLKLENGNLVKVRDSYILENCQLQEQFDLTKKEVNELQNKLNSTLAYISKIESNVYIDTVTCIVDSLVIDTTAVDTTTKVHFRYNDDWLRLNGITKFDKQFSTELYDIYMNVPLKVGLTNDYQIFVLSENPYVNFSKIEGAAINNSILVPKKKRWSWGVQGGIGIGYDLINKNISVGPYAGIGFQYNFK